VADTDEVVTVTKEDYITASCGVPVADFTADVVSGVAPLTVNLVDASTAAEGCDITQWTWAYGLSENDLQTIDGQNPTIVLDEPGSYMVALRATNSAGMDEEIKTDFLTVTDSGADDDDDNDASDDDDDDTGRDDDAAGDDDTGGGNHADDDDDNDDNDSCGCS